jgi:Copper amine oxidase N-terminal domain.
MSQKKKPVMLAMLLIFTCIFFVPGLSTVPKAQASTNPTVTTGSYDDVDEDSATLYGELADAGSLDVDDITAYGIAYGTSSSWSSMSKKTVGSSGLDEGDEFEKTLSGLDSDTKYYYRAFVKFDSDYYYGSAKSFTTDDSSSSDKPEVTTEAADNIDDESATLNGVIESTGDSDITSYGFYWGTSSSLSSMDQEEVGDDSDEMSDGDSFDFDLSDLDSGETYYFRAYATNDSGTAYGSVKSISADEDSSKPTVTTKSATDIEDEGATLNGLLDSIGGDDITEYGFYYGTSSSCSSKKKVGTDDLSDDDTFDYTLSSLSSGTKYYYKAYAKNSYGTTYGSVKNFTTDGSSADEPSVTTNSPTLSGTTAILSGEVTASDTTIKSYGFYYGTDSTCSSRILVGTSGSEGEMYTYNLSGLVSGATYYVKAYATNSAGTSYGTVRSFTVGSSSTGTSTGTNTFTIGASYFYLNGAKQTMDAPPYIRNNRTYMPIRYVCYAMGMSDSNIAWDSAANTVTITQGAKVVKLTIGSKNLYYNGASIPMDVAPEIYNNRTCLPVAWVAQVFGHTASWNEQQQMVTIK